MICPKCGLQTPDGSSFCSHCGNAINSQGRANNRPLDADGSSDAEANSTANYVMSSPPDKAEEVIIWEDHPSMRTAIPGITLWILGGIIALIVLHYVNFPAKSVLSWIFDIAIPGIVVLVVIGVLIRYYVRLHSLRYRLSSQRIFVTHGIFNKRTDEVELEKYKDIFVNQDFWDKMVGCGDIEIVTSDTTNPTIRVIDVPDPIGKKETIRSAARARKSKLGITRREEL